MQPEEIEPEIEEFLHKLIPDLDSKWEGATEFEINKIEEIAGRPLPMFYKWFLLRMGQNMGPLAHPKTDFSASKVIEFYEKENPVTDPVTLLIGYDSNPTPLHTVYLLDKQIRDDATIALMNFDDFEIYDPWETFHSYFIWSSFFCHRILKSTVACKGVICLQSTEIKKTLSPLLLTIGLTIPIDTGNYCALFESHEVSLLLSSGMGTNEFIMFFLAGQDNATLRALLGKITSETNCEMKFIEWFKQ
jgi:hypothetical protein